MLPDRIDATRHLGEAEGGGKGTEQASCSLQGSESPRSPYLLGKYLTRALCFLGPLAEKGSTFIKCFWASPVSLPRAL